MSERKNGKKRDKYLKRVERIVDKLDKAHWQMNTIEGQWLEMIYTMTHKNIDELGNEDYKELRKRFNDIQREISALKVDLEFVMERELKEE